MNDVKGYLEIKMTLNRGQKPDLEKAGSLFGHAAERLGIKITSCKLDSVGSSLRIRAEGVAGVTDVDTPISASFLPGSNGRAGMINIKIVQHPAGPAGAASLADSLAERVATAFNMRLVDDRKVKSKRQGCNALIAALGWNGQFQAIFADFKPGGAA